MRRASVACLRRLPLLVALVLPACRGPEPAAETSAAPHASGASLSAYISGDPALDALQLRFWPVLEANRKQLEGRSGSVLGFGAGDIYPQIWLRDSATLLPLTRYHYDRAHLTSWLEEHLAHQRPSGELFDWIAAGEPASFPYAPRAEQVFRAGELVVTADKNTTEADQETSAVLAAARAHEVLGDVAWLRHDVFGSALIDRLDAALTFVRRERFDEERGLVTNALTADWGDVSPAHGDQQAIYLDEATPLVAGLYSNAMFYGAARALARMHDAAGDVDRRAHWEAEAEAVSAAVDRHLWSDAAGFYRVHEVVDPRDGPVDETRRLAVGGHAVALQLGLIPDERVSNVIAAIEREHERFEVPALAGTLLPPYPAGFFKHPILSKPFTYQNGGQWDWFAGRLLLAMFERGHAEAARGHLVRIAERVRDSDGLFEWYTLDGEGMGSPRYAGSAGALARAVYEGLFGVRLAAEGLYLRVRLGGSSGSLRLREPSTDRLVSFEQRHERGSLLFSWRTQPAPLELWLLLPSGLDATSLTLHGESTEAKVQVIGKDRYLALGPQPAEGSLELH